MTFTLMNDLHPDANRPTGGSAASPHAPGDSTRGDSRSPRGDEALLPAVSVVVIGRNEGPLLARCLKSIRAMDYPSDRIELIYVDSDSKDDSCAVAESFADAVLRITEPPFSAARGRNLGWQHASYEYVHFFDGDTVVDPHWMRKAVGRIGKDGVECVYGAVEEIRPDASMYMRVCTFDWHVPGGPWRICGGIALFRRAILQQIGGFREDLVAGEEPELSYRLRRAGYTIWGLPEPMVLHDLDMMTFGQYWTRAVRSGWAYAVVSGFCWRGPQRLWVRQNLINAGELLGWVALLAGTLAWLGGAGALVWMALLVLRLARIAVRVRRRADGWGTAWLYAGHCVFTRLPIFIGQLRGFVFLLTRRPARLFEDHQPATAGQDATG